MNNGVFPDETAQYKQWVSTDRTILRDCTMSLQKFQENLIGKSDKLTAHHYILKHQSAYFTKLKENIKDDEAIIIFEFAKNYSFVVPDAAQVYHWDNTQATLNPFVAYNKKDG